MLNQMKDDGVSHSVRKRTITGTRQQPTEQLKQQPPCTSSEAEAGNTEGCGLESEPDSDQEYYEWMHRHDSNQDYHHWRNIAFDMQYFASFRLDGWKGWNGVRIGEARHPGPECMFTAVNDPLQPVLH